MAISKITSNSITDGAVTSDDLASGAVEQAMTTQIGGRRNLIINGGQTVWQRGTTADSATSGDYMSDRWYLNHSGLDGNVDWDQETASTPEGFGYALKVSTDASETSLDSSDIFNIQHRFEGQNLQQLKKGTSDAQSLTLSFWVKSSVASTYTAELTDVDNSRKISKSYTISSADTWEHKTVTFEGDTTGAFDNDNALSLVLAFWVDAGSDYTSGTFNTVWGAPSNTERVYNTTGWLESSSPEFYITGVQLEVGTVATPFEHRSYGEELNLCSRYYHRISTTTDNNTHLCVGNVDGSTAAQMIYFFPVTMRTAPTAIDTTGTGTDYQIRMNSNNSCDLVPLFTGASEYMAAFSFRDTAGHGFTNGQFVFGSAPDGVSSYLGWSAEL